MSKLSHAVQLAARVDRVLGDERRQRALVLGAMIAASFSVTAAFALLRGQDFNWDQQNYHIGIPFLLQHGTFWKSVAPAGIQSYFNPYVIELQYLLLTHVAPIAFALIIAAVQSLAFLFAGLVCIEIVRPVARREAVWLALVGFALCLMAPMPLSEAGATFIDLTTAPLIIGAYLLLLTRDRALGAFPAAALAGALLGASAALKLTNAVFAIGAVGFALAGPESIRRRLAWLVVVGGTTLAAFVAVTGRWQLALWRQFGDPFFPYYNNIFHSPDAAAVALRDQRWIPHSFLAIWRYPFYWLLGRSPNPALGSISSEQSFTDSRWIVAIAGLTFFIIALPAFRRWARERLADRTTGFLFAFAISYLAWLGEFGYQRYAAVLDVLCGAALLALAMRLRDRARLPALLALALFALVTIRVPNWGRLPWRPYWQSINPQPFEIGRDAVVFLTSKPSLFIAASLSPDVLYVGLVEFDLDASHKDVMTRKIANMLADRPRRPLKIEFTGTKRGTLPRSVASYGLALTHRCSPLRVANQSFVLCDLARAK